MRICEYVAVDLTQFFEHILTTVKEGNIQRWVAYHAHLKVRIDGAGGKVGYYCLAIHDGIEDSHGSSANDDITKANRINCQPSVCARSDMDDSVLVGVRQFMESPQRVISKGRSKFKRLQPLYDCLRLRTEFWNNLFKIIVFENVGSGCRISLPVFVPDDRELNTACLFLAERVGVSFGQSKGEMIQRIPDILDRITNEQREWLKGDTISCRHKEDITRAIRIWGNSTGGLFVRTNPVSACDIQLINVFPCTLQLQDAARFWGERHDGWPVFLVTEEQPPETTPSAPQPFGDSLKCKGCGCWIQGGGTVCGECVCEQETI